MTRISTPAQQIKYNDPYQQILYPFNNEDSRLYLSRASNFLLKSIGNDVVVKGLKIENITFINGSELEITIGPGLLVQDSTLIEITSSTVVSLDIAPYDSCFGRIILYTNFQYIDSIEANPLKFKMSYITNDGLIQAPINDPWDWHRNRVYLNLYSFTTSPSISIKELSRPNFFYIAGRKYWRRGKANFIPVDDSTSSIDPSYFPLAHTLSTYKIFCQLYDSNLKQLPINTLYLPNTTTVKVSIDEYKPCAPYYSLVINTPTDSLTMNVLREEIDPLTYKKVLIHNLNQQHVMVQVYNNNYELVRLRQIELTDANSITLDFSTFYEDLAARYYVYITSANITTYQITEQQIQNNTKLLVEHNLNKKYVNSQLVNDTTNIIVDSNIPIITLNDQNSLYVNTSACIFPSGDYTLIVYENTVEPLTFRCGIVAEVSSTSYVLSYEEDDLQISGDYYTLEVKHDLNTYYPIVELLAPLPNYNTNIVVQPDIVEVIDENTVRLSFLFTSGIHGVNTVIVYSNNNVEKNYTNADLDVNNKLEINLTSEVPEIVNPIFQVYGSDKKLLIPNNIEKISATIFEFDFNTTPEIDEFTVVFTRTDTDSYIETYTEDDIDPISKKLLITHNLSSFFPIVQLYLNNQIFFPHQIEIVDDDNISVDFKYVDLSQPQSFEIIIQTSIPVVPNIFHYDNGYLEQFTKGQLVDFKFTVNHEMGFPFPIVQVYDYNDYLMNIPIQSFDENTLILDFTDIYDDMDPFLFYTVIVISVITKTTS